MDATRIGIDLAKNVFHLVAMDCRGTVVWRKALTRSKLLAFMALLKPAEVGMEACATAHHWGREIRKLGHEVKLINPAFVTPYRKSGKNDFNDAEAVCEALSRPTMRFVEVKSLAQQDMQSLHGARRLVMKQRTQATNQLRGLLAEYGLIAPRGPAALRREASALSADSERLTAVMQQVTAASLEVLAVLERQLKALDLRIAQACRADENCQRLAEVPGIGPLTATAAVAKVGNARQFGSGRALSAFWGIVPRQHSSGGKTVLLGITKHGDRYMRTLLIHGARAALRVAHRCPDHRSQWAVRLKLKSGPNVAAVALANKNARLIWKLLTSGERYRPQPPAPKAERAPAAQRLASEKSAGRRAALRLEHEPKTPGFFRPPPKPSERTAKKSL
jgi:transposase